MHPKQRFALTVFSKTNKHVFIRQYDHPVPAIEQCHALMNTTDIKAAFVINMETSDCVVADWRN